MCVVNVGTFCALLPNPYLNPNPNYHKPQPQPHPQYQETQSREQSSCQGAICEKASEASSAGSLNHRARGRDRGLKGGD